MLLSSLGTSIANVGLPALAQAFDASFQGVQWIVIAYLLTVTILIVSVGRLADLTGHRRLLLAGIFLYTVASVLCGVAPTLWLLIAARAAQGLGAAVMMALTMAFVGETVPKEKTGSAMGLLGTMSATGTALGPSLGGALISGFGWRAMFLVNVPLGILTLHLASRYLPADRRGLKTNRAGFDYVGTLLLALALAAYALATTIGRGTFGPLNMTLLLAAVFSVGASRVQLQAIIYSIGGGWSIEDGERRIISRRNAILHLPFSFAPRNSLCRSTAGFAQQTRCACTRLSPPACGLRSLSRQCWPLLRSPSRVEAMPSHHDLRCLETCHDASAAAPSPRKPEAFVHLPGALAALEPTFRSAAGGPCRAARGANQAYPYPRRPHQPDLSADSVP